MKLEGFIGPAYTLDSVNVDAQRCVNLYPEVIESGRGKEGQVAYLRGTPGLESLLEVGSGPIRCIHEDSIGRIFVVSGNKLYLITPRASWTYQFVVIQCDTYTEIAASSANVVIGTDTINITAHGYYTGLKIRVSSTSGVPGGLTAGTDYFVIVSGADSFKLASSLANASAGTAIDITTVGTGDLTFTPQMPATAPSFVPSEDIDYDTEEISISGHGFYDGLKVQPYTTGLVPTGLVNATDYFVIKVDDATFKLASSLANAVAGTAVGLTPFTAAEDAKTWAASQAITRQDGDTPTTLQTDSGVVKAASMSFGGNGEDSSTIFVDGENNYLYKDETLIDTFNLLSSNLQVAQATFAITGQESIVVQAAENVSFWLDGEFRIQATTDPGSLASIEITRYYSESHKRYQLIVENHSGAGGILTTAELVEYINTGAVAGKTVNTTYSGTGAEAAFVFTATGGDTYSTTTAFSINTAVSFVSAEVIQAGFGYGSVPLATNIQWIDGFFVVNEGGTNKFYASDLQGFSINSLSFASSEGNPDIVLALMVNHRDLYIFNEKTTEIFTNTGNADFPFERIQGGFLEVGCAAAFSVAKIDGTICWLGRSEYGQGIVYGIKGQSPQRISTHAIEQAIAGYADISRARAYTYQSNGHNFYVLNFDEATWVYDLSTGLWHERAYTNAGTLERHRVDFHAFALGLHIVGDYETNEVYLMKDDVYSDDGDAITRLRSSPHVSSGLNRIFFHRLQLDMEVGIGLDGGVQGSDPTVMLDWSNDGGHSWSSESWALADAGSGEIGDYKKRVVWNRLGSARDRIFRVKTTDPVKIRLIDAQIQAEVGAS